ncbi:hypothetical protein BVY04_04830 [bacterium M21]|nr:hypothetical protein BVY04_04830 [bacterium M21]
MTTFEPDSKIAFLGPEATFTHQATLKHFGHDIQVEGRDTIADVFDAVSTGRTKYGVVPVENSTEGAVRVTFDLFPNYDIHICAEVFLQIHHYMLLRPGTSEIKRIYSHRQVLAQCRRWLEKNYPNCETIETSSTTLAATRAAEEPESAALASVLAAEKYGLEVRHANVEDSSNNITRFLVIGNEPVAPTGDDKTSVMFALADRVGVLYDALLPFKTNNVNMTMIESRPSKSQNWEYIFFVDLSRHASDADCRAALHELSDHCMFMKVLGSYPRAPRG